MRLIEIKTVSVLKEDTVYMEDLMGTTSAKPATSDAAEDPVLPFAVDGLESEDEPKRKDKSGKYCSVFLTDTGFGYSHGFQQLAPQPNAPVALPTWERRPKDKRCQTISR